MNAITSDQHRFDRLADGELTNQQYKTLLASLDDEPGGWRQCALALLEHQALQRDLSDLAHAAQKQPFGNEDTPKPPLHPRKDLPTVARWLLAVAIAASFLVAFGLGMLYSATSRTPAPTGDVVKTPPGRDTLGTNDSQPNSTDATDPRHSPRSGTDFQPVTRQPPQPLERVMLVIDQPDGTAPERIELPVFDRSQLDDDWFAEREPAVPQEMIHTLRRMGHQLRRQRQFVPVVLHDGRRMVVPVEDYEIVPVKGGTYQ